MWCPGSGVVLDLSISDICLFLAFETTCLQEMPLYNSLKKDFKSTGPHSIVVKVSTSEGEGGRSESQCLRQWGLF